MTNGATTEQPRQSARPGLVLLAGWLGVLAAALMAAGAIASYAGALALWVLVAAACFASSRQHARVAEPHDDAGTRRGSSGRPAGRCREARRGTGRPSTTRAGRGRERTSAERAPSPLAAHLPVALT